MSNLCAYGHGKSGCHGDDGGPLMLEEETGNGGERRMVTIGIISGGNKKCEGLTRYIAIV